MIALRGKPRATLQPVEPHGGGKRLDTLKARMTIRRDLVKVDTTGDWDVLR